MKNYAFLLPCAGAVGVLLAACLAAPNEPSSSGSSALSCTATERFFNGSCRSMCAASAQCGASTTCQTVSTGLSLCIDYTQCSHLGSDTECSGVPYGSYTNYDPYWTPYYDDPYASPYGYTSTQPFGCGGNAAYLTAPPAAADDPKCGEQHAVTRCQKVGNRCELVKGSTIDVAER